MIPACPMLFVSDEFPDEAIVAAAAASHMSKYFPILKVWSQDKLLKFTISRGLTVYIYYKGVLFQFVYGVQSEFVAELQGRRHCEEIESRTAPLYQQQQVSARLARRPPHTLLLQLPCLRTENIATSLPKSEKLQSGIVRSPA